MSGNNESNPRISPEQNDPANERLNAEAHGDPVLFNFMLAKDQLGLEASDTSDRGGYNDTMAYFSKLIRDRLAVLGYDPDTNLPREGGK